jgi:hypothetical protein
VLIISCLNYYFLMLLLIIFLFSFLKSVILSEILDISARGVDYNFVYILGRGFFYILDLSVSVV